MKDERSRLRHLGDMEVEAIVEMDRKKMKLSQARRLQPGDVVALEKLAGEAFDVSINGAVFAKGEIVSRGREGKGSGASLHNEKGSES